MPVSQMCDTGSVVQFDSEGGWIHNLTDKSWTRFERRHNVFELILWLSSSDACAERPPDGKWKLPPREDFACANGATFGEDYDAATDCTESSAEQIVNPRAREEQGPVRGNKKRYPRARAEPGPVRGKGTDKKKVARPVGGKGTGKKNVTRAVGGNGTAAGKKKAGR